MRKSTAIFFALFALVSVARADSLQLPLQGYFHPGRAMPVQWDVSGADNGTISVAADQAVATRAQIGSLPRGVFPFLVVGLSPKNIQWRMPQASGNDFPTPLRALDDSDRLVGISMDDQTLATELFRGQSPVVIRLDPRQPIEGPAMAWESLDALILSPQNYSTLSDSMRRQFLSVGVTLAVTGDLVPDNSISWNRSGRLWVARAAIPLPPAVNLDAFGPTQGWAAGRSIEYRGRIVLLAVIFCLLVGAVGLWRSRWMLLAIVAFCASSSVALAWDDRQQSPIASASGNVMLNVGKMEVDDHWVYQVSHRPTSFDVPIDGLCEPLVSEFDQLTTSNFILHCDPGGNVTSISGQLEADNPVAILSRQPGNPSQGLLSTVLPTPMRKLATPDVYPGFSIYAEIVGDQWPGVILSQNR